MRNTTGLFSHLKKAAELETTYEETRAGFLALALEKSRKAIPVLDEARALKDTAEQAGDPNELLEDASLEPALLTAAGFSDKAMKHIEIDDRRKAIETLIEEFLLPAGANFPEELVFRFLLTKGDGLGGSMRNLAGFLAQRKFIRCITAQLRLKQSPYLWLSLPNTWVTEDDPEQVEIAAKGLSWRTRGEHRTLIFNSRIPSLGTINIDLFLMACTCETYKNTYCDCSTFLALGELKGGIDPAGADEHWKTAKSAFDRIRGHFESNGHGPDLFFVGAAIVPRVAEEIWAELKARRLTYAANLNRNSQMTGICKWLTEL